MIMRIYFEPFLNKILTVSTYATQGTFTTPYFKQDFDLNKFSLISDYKLTIWIPDSVYKSKTIDLVLEIDYDLMERHGSQSFEIVSISSSRVEKLETFNKKIVKRYLQTEGVFS